MPPGRERCLLLCMAYPEYSKNYGATVCMAGITESGELRRIYPVPFDNFREINYKKRRWIEYDIEEKGDYRKESYKIDPESVDVGTKETYTEVRNRLEDRATTFDELNKRQEADHTSLGFIQPEVLDFRIDKDEDRARRSKRFREQTTLTGANMPIEVIPHYFRYVFYCGSECDTQHEVMCEDIEAGQLYRTLHDKYDSLTTIEKKMKERFENWMREERDLYFMVGTHFQYGNWLIISVLYPEQREDQKISQFI